MNGNWIKLHRDLHGKFSNNRRIDSAIWHLYVYLLEKANWIDSDLCKRGQLITTHKIIEQDIPLLSRSVIRTSLDLLIQKSFIEINRVNKWTNSGFLINIVHYDSLQGENSESYPQKIAIKSPSDSHQIAIKSPTDDHQIAIKSPSNVSCNDLDNVDEIACSKNAIAIKSPSDSHQIAIKSPTDDHQVAIKSPYNSKDKEKEEKKEEEEIKISSCDSPESSPRKISFAAIVASAKKPEEKKKKAVEGINPSELIGDYITAYSARYGVKPLITGVVAATAKNLIKRVGLEKAKQLVKFYLTHNNQYYLGKAHDLKLCLADAEKLHTEMCKQNYIYTTDARDFEQASSNEAIRLRLIEKHRERD